MSKTLLSKDNRGLKDRLKDFAAGSDNFSRMGKGKKKRKMLPHKPGVIKDPIKKSDIKLKRVPTPKKKVKK